MSSHREAPETAKDPVADSTDLYAFVSTNPAEAGTVTIIANYIPLEDPAGGPNFYEFGDDVQYRINVDTNGDGCPDTIYEFKFQTEVRQESFLYNTGPIETLDSDNWNRRQHFSVTEIHGDQSWVLMEDLLVPPCNIGPRSTPNYADLAAAAVYQVRDGVKVFAGQRLDGFYVDLGSVFDLGALRPFQNLHLVPTPAGDPVNALRSFNVHSIALQVDIGELGERRRTDGPDGARGGDRRVDHRRSPEGLGAPGRRDRADLGPVRPGLPARQPAGQRGAHPGRAEGSSGTTRRRRTTPRSPSTPPNPSWPSCCPCCTPTCSPTSPR